MKYGRKWWFRERGKMWCFPLEIQQFCNIDEFNESVNAAKFEYFLEKYEDYEKQSTTTKKGDSHNAYNYYRFWRILMIRRVEEGLRTFSFWVWQPPQQDFEAPMIPKRITHYVILSMAGATARFWKVLFGEFERHCRRVTKMRLLAGGKSWRTLMD